MSASKSEKECPHCSEILSRQAFYRHKLLYYKNGVWKRKIKGTLLPDTKITKDNNHTSNSLDEEPVDKIHGANEDLFYEDISFENDEGINADVWTESTEPDEDYFGGTNESISFQSNTDKIVTVFVYQLFALQSTFSISDNVAEIILTLIHSFLALLKNPEDTNNLEKIIKVFPSRLFSAKKMMNLENNAFIKYVSCPEDCSIEKDGKKESAHCTYVRYPDHPQRRFREKCGTALMKSFTSSDGKKNYLYPKRMYCYQPLKQSLQNLISRKDIIDNLLTGPPKGPEGVMFDTVDGNFWKTFKDENNEPYFNDSRNLGGILNIDWFQPFENIEHSTGVIYTALLNLPREIRYKWENVIINGIIPGPNEPKKNVNSYLQPLVDDLLSLWRGELFNEGDTEAFYKYALCCISSDLPATRKCCGFLSYNANRGCSKCFKEFVRDGPFGTKPDYSGYDENSWAPRSWKQHSELSMKHKAAKTQREGKEIESEYGLRYSELSRLPYYDPIKCHLVDPMHCLLLGVAKHTLKVWIELNILSKNKLKRIDEKMSLLKLPPGYGAIPSAISSAFNKMKSDEYKTWVLYISLFVLKDVLPKPHYNMWQAFVRACKMLLKPYITVEEVYSAHELLKLFNNTFVRIVGSDHCTPNMHMQMHIKDCIMDFGPVYAFWCYSFERYNGVLGEYQTNNRSITMQLMRQFLNCHSIVTAYKNLDIEVPSLQDLKILTKEDEHLKHIIPLHSFRLSKTPLESLLLSRYYTFLSGAKSKCLSRDDMKSITEFLSAIFSNCAISILHIVKSYLRVKIGRDVIASSSYRKSDNKNQFIFINQGEQNRPGFVTDIVDISVEISGKGKMDIAFFEVSIFKRHTYKDFFGLNCPMKIWDTQP